MKLGICSLWGESLEQYRMEVRAASACGYDVIGAGEGTVVDSALASAREAS